MSTWNNEIQKCESVRHKGVVSSFAAQLSRLSAANRSVASDGQTEMTASLCLPHKSRRLPIKSIHAAIIAIVSHDMYEIGNNGAPSRPLWEVMGWQTD